VSPQSHTHLDFEGYQYAREQGKGNEYNYRVLEAFFEEIAHYRVLGQPHCTGFLVTVHKIRLHA
jgi:hypothetical protein